MPHHDWVHYHQDDISEIFILSFFILRKCDLLTFRKGLIFRAGLTYEHPQKSC